MLDLLPELEALLGSSSLGSGPSGSGRSGSGQLRAGLLGTTPGPQACAVATIVGATGSVPRALGTSMLVSERGEVRGSLSGGCVEGAVFAACTEAIASGLPRREHFGYSDDDAFAAGLLCGGSLEVHIQPFYPRGATGAFPPAAELPTAVDVSAGCALVRRIDGQSTGTILVDDPLGFDPASIAPELLSLLGEPGMARSAAAQLEPLVRAGHTGVIRLAPGRRGCRDQPVELFVESRLPAPLMLVYGANDFAAALTRAAKPLGYRITLCDARAAFATPAAFPQADDVVIQWPHAHLDALSAGGPVDPRTVVCVLTHDAKFDIPVLRRALEMGFAYVGAMGSRASDRQRRAALVEAGVAPEQLARLRSPIGLDLGASSPQEVAVSIVAEILAARHGKNVPRPLSQVAGPIH